MILLFIIGYVIPQIVAFVFVVAYNITTVDYYGDYEYVPFGKDLFEIESKYIEGNYNGVQLLLWIVVVMLGVPLMLYKFISWSLKKG